MDVTGQNLAGRSYALIYSDPPWLFSLHSDKGEEKSPQAQYDCMTTNQICKFMKDLLEWCTAPNAVHVMWGTFPMMADALQVMEASGFKYKTGGAWGKTTEHGKIAFGTGYIYRSAAELWLVGTRGEPRSLVKDQRNLILDDGVYPPSPFLTEDLDTGATALLLDQSREHSRKPASMIEIIERQFRGPYLEVFARADRPGWDVWGNQVGKFD